MIDPILRAIMVSVDYTDLLKLTLPYNRQHFKEVMIVTSPADAANVVPVAEQNDCKVYATNAFYEGGADFNKWKALEQGLDCLGRWDWLCIMDADVLWPKIVDLERYLRPGYLYAPYRRMCDPVPTVHSADGIRTILPPEDQWSKYPLHRQQHEFAGYSQIFHASDPILGKAPWHQTNWRHAGGADSFFQARWPKERKVRPGWQVLHLGPAGVNWAGRASMYTDGKTPVQGKSRYDKLLSIVHQRRHRVHGVDPYKGDKLP